MNTADTRAPRLGDPEHHGLPALLGKHRAESAIALALLIGFFALYFVIGQEYRTLPGYTDYRNVFFGADHRDAIRGWVDDHKGSHPLVLLIVVPLTGLLELVAPSRETGLVLYCAGFGALTVASFFVLVRMLAGRTGVAAAIALFFGLSMSQLVFACIPDTYVLAAALLIPTYILTLLCVRRRELYLPLWVPAALGTFAVTITNLVQTLIGLGVVLITVGERGKRLRAFLAVLLLVAGAGFALSLVQKAVFPGAKLFFAPDTYVREMEYASDAAVDEPLEVAVEMLKTFFLLAFIGQFPVNEVDYRAMLVYTGEPLAYGWLATSAALLWIGLLLRGVFLSFLDGGTRAFTLVAALAVAANMGIHAVYSTQEMFLFTPHFAFAVLLTGVSERSTRGRIVALAWWLLVVLASLSNAITVSTIVSHFIV